MTNLNDLPEGVHVHTVAGTAAEDLMLKVYLDGVATGAGTIVYTSLLSQDVPEPDANKHAKGIAHHLCDDLYADPLRRAEILTKIQKRFHELPGFHELPATGIDHPDRTEKG